METYRSIASLPIFENTVLTIGNYDGLHLGHQAVIERLVDVAKGSGRKSVVVTFFPHPRYVLGPVDDAKPGLIASIEKKFQLMEGWGVDVAFVVPFDRALSQVSAEEFLAEVLIKNFNPSSIIIGHDHHFGHNRQGDSLFLENQKTKFGYDLEVIHAINSKAGVISSSRIRAIIGDGDCERANRLLGWVFEIWGTIIEGEKRGRTLGFPTANVMPLEENQLIPKVGVYVVSTELSGRTVYGMCNVGYRPTFNETELIIEANFFDPPITDLYDRRIALKFHHRLRAEKGFDGVKELKAQLQKDKRESLEWIAIYERGVGVNVSA